MFTRLPVRIWLVAACAVERDRLRDLAPPDAELVDDAEFGRRLEGGERPDAALVDADTLESLDGQRLALDGIIRTLVLIDDGQDGLPSGYATRPSVCVLRRPVTDRDLQRGLDWLAGGEDDGWAEPISA